jgi:hypothetical protein
MNCGKQELYAQRRTISRLELYTENGELKEQTNTEVKYGEPRCPKCGRYVKFLRMRMR